MLFGIGSCTHDVRTEGGGVKICKGRPVDKGEREGGIVTPQVLRNEIGSAISQFFSRHGNCILGFMIDAKMCHPSKIAYSNSR